MSRSLERRIVEDLPLSIALIQRGYRLFAPLYDLVFGPSLQSGRRAAVAALDCRAGDRVLEVCVGTGLALPMYPKGARVVGVDISREMLAKAAKRTGGLPQVEGLLQMDAQRLSFADGSFDKVTMLYGLSGIPDPLAAVNEMRRVCRPGGTLVIAGHFQCEGPLLRLCEQLLAPIYALLRYRSDLDFERFQSAAKLDVIERRSANLFGYTTLLVCRNRAAQPALQAPSGDAVSDT